MGGPKVSPDGKHLLFLVVRKDGAWVYRTVSTVTGKVESEYRAPLTAWIGTGWMPDNRSVAVEDLRSGVPNLWALPVLGGGPEKQITHYTSGAGQDLEYSPDGKWLVMERGPDSGNAVMFREGGK